MSNLLSTAISLQTKSKGGDNTCQPSAIALTFFEQMPEEIKPFFNTPRGIQNDEGSYLGSIVQIAKGSLGRLHGPALEFVGRELLDLIVALDERDETAQLENPLIIVVDDKEVEWDVRRYSSSQNSRGQWQSIPDYSIYFDTTQRAMRQALSTEEDSEEKPEENTRRRRSKRG
jgi:hypothetical protein